jgi:hypothetical protein
MSLNARKSHGPGASAAGRRWETVATVTLKVAVQPGVSGGRRSVARPAVLLAAVTCWALLTVQNIFIAASRYRHPVHADRVLISTVLSMGSLSLTE